MGQPIASWGSFHSRKKMKRQAIVDSGRAVLMAHHSRLQIALPYHPDWPGEAAKLGGRWRERSGIWSFHGPWRRPLNAIVRVYGQGVLPENWEETRLRLNAKAPLEDQMREGI